MVDFSWRQNDLEKICEKKENDFSVCNYRTHCACDFLV